ncbi:MAG: phenylacetate-CoA oxygenase subunit PaaI [Betaproteobacteria bacterium]|nr:phenylacetate-CoA oxygenase subunit PaaI [Betaproteobacteria bacterium]
MGDCMLILGHRLSQWCGHAPVLEEDLALANTALDLLGQARRWLAYAGELEGKGRDEDDFAFQRDTHEYRNFLLVEQDNGNYADTIARQFYFDFWHQLQLAELKNSSDERVAAMARQAHTEVVFHARRSRDLVIRLGDGTAESHRRMQQALDEFWIYTGELFEVDEDDEALVENKTIGDVRALHAPWLKQVSEALNEGTLRLPQAAGMRSGGRRGVHSERLGYLLAEMQFLPRAYPGAKW